MLLNPCLYHISVNSEMNMIGQKVSINFLTDFWKKEVRCIQRPEFSSLTSLSKKFNVCLLVDALLNTDVFILNAFSNFLSNLEIYLVKK